MENSLYNKHAQLYFQIAQDRDFDYECKLIVNLHSTIFPKNNVTNSLELFAGPGYHSVCLASKFKLNVKCIDSSNEMRSIAFNSYPNLMDQYEIGLLPFCLRSTNIAYDLIIIMRYSIGLISPNELVILLEKLSMILSPTGIIIIELHKEGMFKDTFTNLKIKERIFTCNYTNKTIKCLWPAGNLKWHNEILVEMPIRLVLRDADKEEVITTSSNEYLYDKKYLTNLVDNSKISLIHISNDSFQEYFSQSTMLVLKGKGHEI